MIEQRLPIITRWMLYALGAVEGRRVRRPIDAVSGWLINHQPGLLPSVPQSALLSTIRARTSIIDRMLEEEIHQAWARKERVVTEVIGGSFDARWHRLLPGWSDTVVEHRETETPALLELKSQVLANSPYEDLWKTVVRRPLPEDRWGVDPKPGARSIVVIEVGAGRLEEEGLRRLLQRIRFGAPEARLLVGLPAPGGIADTRWSRRSLAGIGWRVEEDVHLATRGRLLSSAGSEVCAGMYPFRVVRLSAREPKQS